MKYYFFILVKIMQFFSLLIQNSQQQFGLFVNLGYYPDLSLYFPQRK